MHENELIAADSGLPAFVDQLVELARQSAEPKMVLSRSATRPETLAILPGGDVKVFEPEFDPPNFIAHTFDSLATIWSTYPLPDGVEPLAVVTGHGVDIYPTPHARVDPERVPRVSYPFNRSDIANRIAAGFAGDQAAALRWLRSSVVDYIPDGAKLFAALRSLKFKVTAGESAAAAASRASYGSTEEFEMTTGGESLDRWDSFTVEIPLLDDPTFGRLFPVRCFLDVCHRTQRIEIAAFAGELDAAWSRMRHAVVSLLEELLPDVSRILGDAESTAWSARVSAAVSESAN